MSDCRHNSSIEPANHQLWPDTAQTHAETWLHKSLVILLLQRAQLFGQSVAQLTALASFGSDNIHSSLVCVVFGWVVRSKRRMLELGLAFSFTLRWFACVTSMSCGDQTPARSRRLYSWDPRILIQPSAGDCRAESKKSNPTSTK